jgi:arabinofuranosyltransferase
MRQFNLRQLSITCSKSLLIKHLLSPDVRYGFAKRATSIEKLVFFGVLAAAAIYIFRSLWISDDAAITLRTVLNFVNGYGARFNIDERVQAYTHPLWFVLLCGITAIVGNVYSAAWALALVIMLLTFWLVATRLAANLGRGTALVVTMMLSKSCFDFGMSGLENPLSHLLIVSIVLTAYRALNTRSSRALHACFLLMGLIYLSRPDLVLLVAPLGLFLISIGQFSRRTRASAVALCVLPVLGWSVFSLIYYGFLFPNTAYAKLNTAISFADRSRQGLLYLWDSLNRDPLTLLTIAFSMVVAYGNMITRMIAVGIVLYLAYVVSIGGDFMSGRFLSTAFVAAICVIATAPSKKLQRSTLVFFVIAVGLNVYSTSANGLFQRLSPSEVVNGIADERHFLRALSLRDASPGTFDVPSWRTKLRSVIVTCGGLGMLGIKLGPSVHLIDECALADPLLARLPPKHDDHWRPGHFIRQIPTDYVDTVRQRKGSLPDTAVNDLYVAVQSATREPLFSSDRWRNLIALNVGGSRLSDASRNRYVNDTIARVSVTPKLRAESLAAQTECRNWDAPNHLVFEDFAEIEFALPTVIKTIAVTADATDEYAFDYWDNGRWHAFARLGAQPEKATFDCLMVEQRVSLDTPLPAVTRIRVRGKGDQMYSISRFRVNEAN